MPLKKCLINGPLIVGKYEICTYSFCHSNYFIYFFYCFQGKSTIQDINIKQFRMGSKPEEMRMEDFIKIEKIGEGKAILFSAY